MRTRRLSAFTAGVVALSLVAAACGDDDDDGAADTEAPAEDEAAGEEEEAPAETEAPAEDEEMAEEEDMSDEEMAEDEEMADEEMAEEEMAEEEMAEMAECESIDSTTLHLQWFIQAQFAGYFAAQDKGFYEDFCLEVEIIEGGVEIPPQVQVANGDVDFAIAWVPKALESREAGANITNIAQIFQRSGTLQVSFADSGITSPEDFDGKNIGNWGYGNEYEVFAAIGEAGLDLEDVTHVQQQFDMVALLDGDIDAAEAMTYNEYAQVLEAENPDTGELYQPEDFNVISYEEVGVGMLQDAVWAAAERLETDEAYRDIATRFVAASIEGWAYCRDNVEECRDIVVAKGSTLGASHQLWQMNEVNKLIWPAEGGVGYIDQAAWDRTVEISQNTPNLDGATVLSEAPTDGAFTNDVVEAAWALLESHGLDLDLTGEGFAPIEVELQPGGE